MRAFELKRADNNRNKEHDEADEWVFFRRQYELWRHFMLNAWGCNPAPAEKDDLLVQMLSGTYIMSENSQLIPAAQADAASHARVIMRFDHINTWYDNSNDQEELKANNFAYNLNSSGSDEAFRYAIMERSKAALALVAQAHALGWQTVDFDDTKDPLERYLLQSACTFYKLEYVNESDLPQKHSEKKVEHINAIFNAVKDAPAGDIVYPQGWQNDAPPPLDDNEAPQTDTKTHDDPFTDEIEMLANNSSPTTSKSGQHKREFQPV